MLLWVDCILLAGFIEENFGLYIGETPAEGRPASLTICVEVSFSSNTLFIGQLIYFIVTYIVA